MTAIKEIRQARNRVEKRHGQGIPPGNELGDFLHQGDAKAQQHQGHGDVPDIQIEQRNGPYLLPFLDPRPEHLGREDEQPPKISMKTIPTTESLRLMRARPVGHGGQGKRVPDGVLLFNPDLPPVQDGEDQGDETIGGDKREDTVGEVSETRRMPSFRLPTVPLASHPTDAETAIPTPTQISTILSTSR